MSRPRKPVTAIKDSSGRIIDYQANVYAAGGRSRRRLGTTNPETAMQRYQDLMAALEREVQRRQSTLLDSALERFIYERRHKISERTVVHYRHSIGRFLEFLKARDIGSLADLAESDARGYAAWLAERYCPTSINIHLRAAKVFLRYFDMDRIARRHLELAKVRPKAKRILSNEELGALVKAADSETGIMIQVIRHTGMRRDELLSLKWQQISLDEKTIRILGKGDKERLVPINGSLAAILSALPRSDSEFVFPRKDGLKRWPSSFAEAFRSAVKEAEIPYCTPHDLRRTVATRLKEKGVSDKVIQAVLGHVSIDTTYASYIELSPEYRRGVMERLE